MAPIRISPDFATFRIPRRANRWGRYTAHCFKGCRRYRPGDVDCGTDSRPFGKHLAARAWWLGGFGAVREGLVGDGQKAQRQAGYLRVVRIRPSMTADSGSILDENSGIDFPA